MSTTGTSEAAANFIKTYTHDKFIRHPTAKVYHGVEVDHGYQYQSHQTYDSHYDLKGKVMPLIGHLQFSQRNKPFPRKLGSNGSLNYPDSITEEEEHSDFTDSSYESTDGSDKEVVHPVYNPELSSSPRESYMHEIDEKAKLYLQNRGHIRRASAPVNMNMSMTDITENEEEPTTPSPTVSKDETDVPETPVAVIESLRHEAAIRSQVKMRQMKHLDMRRGSMPVLPMSQVQSSKPISNDRVHQIMRTFYGPNTKKQQEKQVGVLDPSQKSPNIQINAEQKIIPGTGKLGVGPPRQPAVPVAPPPPEIMPSALMGAGDDKNMGVITKDPIVTTVEKPKLTEVVASLAPSVTLPHVESFSDFGTFERRSSATQDLEDAFRKLDRSSGDFSDSGSFSQSGEGGSSWFGGLIGLRPAPAPRQPGEKTPVIKRKVKKRDLNAFAPAGF